MSKTTKVLVFLLCFVLLKCSKDPVQPENEAEYLSPTTPENVIRNVELSYNNKDVKKYLECLSNDFEFQSVKAGIWHEKEEKQIHTQLFHDADEIKLNLTGKVITYEHEKLCLLPRSYSLILKYDSAFTEESFGEVVFYLCKQGDGTWKIIRWKE